MAGMYDVESLALPYGSVDAAGYRGLQSEMMRRAQMQAEQEKLARQAQLDAEKRQQDAINQQIALESLASVKENRASEAEKRQQDVLDTQRKAFQATHVPGAELTPADEPLIAKLGLGSLTLAKPAVAGTKPLAEGEVGPELPASPASRTYLGTPAEQQDAKEQELLGKIVSGELKIDRTDPIKGAAQWRAAGGKTALPAAYFAGPKTASETKAAHDIKMQELMSQVEQGYQPTADEAADLKVWRGFNPTTAEKNTQTEHVLTVRNDNASERQVERYVQGNKKNFRQSLDREQAALGKDLERVDRARALLNSKTFTADAVAAPEFLQIVAGGMGSGLRMTDAELRRVNDAQTKLDQWRGVLAKMPGAQLFGIEAKTIGDKMRKEMQDVLKLVDEGRKREAQVQSDTLRKISDAKSEDEVDNLQADYWEKKREAISMFNQIIGGGGGGAAAAAPKMTPGLTGLANRK